MFQKCNFGSCNSFKGHKFDHRCVCGALVIVSKPECPHHSLPPVPLTSSGFAAYLSELADYHFIEDQPMVINGKPIVNARVVEGQLHLETFEDFLTYQEKHG